MANKDFSGTSSEHAAELQILVDDAGDALNELRAEKYCRGAQTLLITAAELIARADEHEKSVHTGIWKIKRAGDRLQKHRDALRKIQNQFNVRCVKPERRK